MTEKRVMTRNALFVIFTLSGFSGLIYESIWSHYFKLFLGHAAYAQSLVLVVFMGGMALGAWGAARMSPRLGNLLLAYALVEALTGAIALGFHPVYLAGVGFTFDTVIPSLDSPAAINTAKWSIAALLILPQSVLLGATFPLISGGVVRRFPGHPGATLAMLYFTNSLGAALGVLASGFWLIGKIGLPGTVMSAGLVNIALGLVVWMYRGSEPAPAPASGAVHDSEAAASSLARRILLVAFLSGVAAFVYEIAWIRMLSLVLGASTHAFELMLSAFILGLAFGGLFIRKYVDRLTAPLATLAFMFALMAILALLTLPAYGFTFDVVAAAMRGFGPTESGYVGFNLVSHAIAAAVMIPTTFIAGMTLPVMTQVLLRQSGERAIGRVYACNTVGAIVGVLIAVHLLLPGVGLKGAVLAGVILQLLIAVILQPRVFSASGARRVQVTLAAGVACLLVVALLLRLDPLRMASGVYRKGQARLPPETEILFMRDGKTATISLARQGGTVTISTNGKPDAAINRSATGMPNPDEITMTMAGALPLAIHRDPRQIANIGIGSGLTSHIVLASERVERLDSIEIEPVIAQAAKLGFGERVSRLFEDPRSHIHYEDAKTFFSATKRKYDVIISEPSNPWVSGVATLFSDEFYGQITHHLNADGLLVQWVQIYETDLTIVASIVKALSPHFADYVIYSADDANIIIVASVTEKIPALNARVFDSPRMTAELRRFGFQNLGDLEIRRIGDKHLLDALMTSYPVPANSDFYPYVDLNAPRMRFLNRDALDLVRLGHLAVPIAEIMGHPLRSSVSGSAPPDSAAAVKYLYRHRLALEAQAILRAVQSGSPDDAPAEARNALRSVLNGSAACAEATAQNDWLQAVYLLGARTSPFVPIVERAVLWERIRASGCMSTLAAPEQAWFELLAAIAAADNAAIATQGVRMLGNPPAQISGNQLLEALIATVCAQTATGQQQKAMELLSAYLPMLQNAGQFTLALRLVQSLALRPPGN